MEPAGRLDPWSPDPSENGEQRPATRVALWMISSWSRQAPRMGAAESPLSSSSEPMRADGASRAPVPCQDGLAGGPTAIGGAFKFTPPGLNRNSQSCLHLKTFV